MRQKKIERLRAETEIRTAEAEIAAAVRQDRWESAKVRFRETGDVEALKGAAIAYYADAHAFPLHVAVISAAVDVAAIVASQAALA